MRRKQSPRVPSSGSKVSAMPLLKWALFFFVVSVVAVLFGFAGLSVVARVVFYIVVVVGFIAIPVLGLIIFRPWRAGARQLGTDEPDAGTLIFFWKTFLDDVGQCLKWRNETRRVAPGAGNSGRAFCWVRPFGAPDT
jgi:uncharacterized membrane protein YtjA (UPF0391 family)